MDENNFNKFYKTNDTSTVSNLNFNNSYCIHRLPCGYCKILEKSCPMYFNNIPMYNPCEITCETKGNM